MSATSIARCYLCQAQDGFRLCLLRVRLFPIQIFFMALDVRVLPWMSGFPPLGVLGCAGSVFSTRPHLVLCSSDVLLFLTWALNETDHVPNNYLELIFEVTRIFFLRFILVWSYLNYLYFVIRCHPRLWLLRHHGSDIPSFFVLIMFSFVPVSCSTVFVVLLMCSVHFHLYRVVSESWFVWSVSSNLLVSSVFETC